MNILMLALLIFHGEPFPLAILPELHPTVAVAHAVGTLPEPKLDTRTIEKEWD